MPRRRAFDIGVEAIFPIPRERSKYPKSDVESDVSSSMICAVYFEYQRHYPIDIDLLAIGRIKAVQRDVQPPAMVP